MNHLTFEEAHKTVIGTIKAMANKYSLMHDLADYNELLHLGALTVWKQLPSWDPSRSKWNTYFTMHFRATCQGYIRTLPTVKCRESYSLNVPLSDGHEEFLEGVDVLHDDSTTERLEAIDHVRQWLSMLSKDERSVLEARYLSDRQPTMQQVADAMGVDAKTVAMLERNAINKLRSSFGVTYRQPLPRPTVVAQLSVGKSALFFAANGTMQKLVQKVRQRVPGSHFKVRVACPGEGSVRGRYHRHFYVTRTA